MNTMRSFFVTLGFIFAYVSAFAGNMAKCDLEMAEIGKAGTLVVKVWTYSKSRTVSNEALMKNAIWGICFKGVSDNKTRRMNGVKPLVDGDYEQNKAYFEEFLKTADLSHYVTIGLDGYVEQGDVIKMKKKYKVGRIVVIHLSDLRKRLEQDGIIKSLTNGF